MPKSTRKKKNGGSKKRRKGKGGGKKNGTGTTLREGREGDDPTVTTARKVGKTLTWAEQDQADIDRLRKVMQRDPGWYVFFCFLTFGQE